MNESPWLTSIQYEFKKKKKEWNNVAPPGFEPGPPRNWKAILFTVDSNLPQRGILTSLTIAPLIDDFGSNFGYMYQNNKNTSHSKMIYVFSTVYYNDRLILATV